MKARHRHNSAVSCDRVSRFHFVKDCRKIFAGSGVSDLWRSAAYSSAVEAQREPPRAAVTDEAVPDKTASCVDTGDAMATSTFDISGNDA